ncbi:MAG: hypothetical protein RL700_484 [Pseudomonadota bacterium]
MYAGQANTIGVASNTLPYDIGNTLYVGANGAGVTANGNSSAPTTGTVTAMMTKSLYDKVFADISKANTSSTADTRVFNQVMGNGNDTIDAGAGSDWVMGGYGNDTISGGRGDDVLWGRGGGTHTVSLNIIQGSSSTTTTITETADVVFSDGLKVGESVTVGGLTITAIAAMTTAQVANAFTNLAVNATLPTNSAYSATGSMAGWSSGSVTASGVNSVVKFTSSTASSNVTDLTASYKLLDNDTFKWATGDAAGSTTPVDVIKDFTEWSNSSGDRLDILGLLTGYTSGTSILSDWVTVAINQTAPSTSTANSTKIDIDIDGLGTDTVKQIIWLEGVTLSTTDVAVLKANGVLIA